MTLIELARQAKEARDAQSRYFTKRDNIDECKRLERALDDALGHVLDPGLFDVVPSIGAEEIVALAEKTRAAQRRATAPADYDCQYEAQTAQIYGEQLDEAIARYHRQQAQETGS